MAVLDEFRCRLLRANHGRSLPSQVLYLDTETRVRSEGVYQVHYLRLAWTCAVRYTVEGKPEREQWQEWKDGKKLWEYVDKVIRPRTCLYLFAHNVFFDLQASGFFREFARRGWVLDFLHERGTTYILIAHQERRTLKVVSTTNFFECSVAGLGGLVGLPKQEVDFRTVGEKKLSEYCRRDVEIIKAAMESYFRFLSERDLGQFKLSRAGQAMQAFRHRFMRQKVYLHEDEKVRSLEREAYYGGRTECFRLGQVEGGPFVVLDVNSLYPFVMAHTPVPVKLVEWRDTVEPDLLPHLLRDFAVVSRVRLRTEEPLYPWRRKHKVIYPVGEFSTVLCTPALEEAWHRGHLAGVGETAVYRKAVLFQEYVEYFWPLKQRYSKERNWVWRYSVKTLMNALYGKFAQKRPVVEEQVDLTYEGYAREEVLDGVTGKTEIQSKLLNRVITTFGEEDTPQTFTAISAHITEAARLHLWRLMEKAGRERVLYCDTDSLILRASEVGELAPEIADGKLGALQIEDQFDTLQIYGAKAYQTEGKRIIKGIPKGAEKVGPVSYRYTAFLKQATHLTARKDTGVLTHEVLKVLRAPYDKGEVKPDGQVVPFRVSDVPPLVSPPVEFSPSASGLPPVSPWLSEDLIPF